MKNIAYALVFSLSALFFASCNLEQTIDIDLPEYDNQIMVECYLIPGEPFALALTRSAGFFDAFPSGDDFLESILVDSAQVFIRYDDQEVELSNLLFFDQETGRAFNYISLVPIPVNYDSEFELAITLPDGETITGKTKIVPPVPIDSIVVEFDEIRDSLARALVYFEDDPSATNYYRQILTQNSFMDSIPYQDFAFDDGFSDSTTIAIGTIPDFKEGDVLYSTLIHISRDYYDFINSIFLSVESNGNPFGQPSTILSNVEGSNNPLGVFTGFTIVRDTALVAK